MLSIPLQSNRKSHRSLIHKGGETKSYQVRITESVMRSYKETIAAQPPETFALLGGRLDDPFTITDFRFCPPRKRNGGYDRSSVHVNVDPDYMNFVVDEELKPAGKYMLGIWHSHPNGSRSPSIGDESRNEGDMVFFRSCLRNDDSPTQDWTHFIAPITTFTPDGSDRIDVWVVTLDAEKPIRANHSILRERSTLTLPEAENGVGLLLHGEEMSSYGLPLDAIRSRLDMYQAYILELANMPDIDTDDREALIAGLRRLMARELKDIAKGRHPLGQYIEALGNRAIATGSFSDEGDEQES